MKALLLLSICLKLSLAASAQEPRIKREIELTYHYHDDDDKIVIPDTVITEYDAKGKPRRSSNGGSYSSIDSTICQSIDTPCKHWKQYWGDSAVHDIYMWQRQDTTMWLTMNGNDTLMLSWQITRQGVVRQGFTHVTAKMSMQYDEVTHYSINTAHRKKGTTSRTGGDGWAGISKFDSDMKRKVYKTYTFNRETKHWHLHTRAHQSANERVQWELRYDSDRRRYDRIKRTNYYDSHGHVKEDVEYDSSDRRVTMRTVHLYEYY